MLLVDGQVTHPPPNTRPDYTIFPAACHPWQEQRQPTPSRCWALTGRYRTQSPIPRNTWHRKTGYLIDTRRPTFGRDTGSPTTDRALTEVDSVLTDQTWRVASMPQPQTTLPEELHETPFPCIIGYPAEGVAVS